jgi:hypothetical protein
MKSEDVTADQAKRINEAIGPTVGFLHELRSRMNKLGFGMGDPLFVCVNHACEALHTLNVKTHYMSCNSGVCSTARTLGDFTRKDGPC